LQGIPSGNWTTRINGRVSEGSFLSGLRPIALKVFSGWLCIVGYIQFNNAVLSILSAFMAVHRVISVSSSVSPTFQAATRQSLLSTPSSGQPLHSMPVKPPFQFCPLNPPQHTSQSPSLKRGSFIVRIIAQAGSSRGELISCVCDSVRVCVFRSVL